MAGVDIADSRHTGAGSRAFNQSATVILTLEELKKWIVLKQGESMEEITGDARARRSAAAAAAPRQEAGTAAKLHRYAVATSVCAVRMAQPCPPTLPRVRGVYLRDLQPLTAEKYNSGVFRL